MAAMAPRQKTRRVIAGLVALTHVLLVVMITQMPSEGSWRWFPIFALDFPV